MTKLTQTNDMLIEMPWTEDAQEAPKQKEKDNK